MPIPWYLLLAAAVFTAPLALLAQQPVPAAEPKPSFEVASVRRNRSGDMGTRFGGPPGRFTVTNAPVRQLIVQAYQIQPSQLVGGPGWIDEERYDIVASTGGQATGAPSGGRGGSNPAMLMLQSLLEERFGLRMHLETRAMAVYALVAARGDGRLGPQLKPADVDCTAMFAGRGRGDAGVAVTGRAGAAPQLGGPGTGPGQRPPCSVMMGPGSVVASGTGMTELARLLSLRAGRIVIDRTGLTGLYDFELTFLPDQVPPPVGGGPPPGAAGPPPVDPNAPSLFTALQEQLGLKLESTRAPVDVFVIDSINRPTED